MNAPLVSVVITTFNTGRYLPETLESVFAQSHANYEIIVVDDGSTDDTPERARAYASRITLIEREHEGLGPARNAGLALATGDYVAFLDSDDVWEPDALRIQLEVARQHPESGLVVGDGVEFAGSTVLNAHLFPDGLVTRLNATADGQLTGPMYHEFLAASPVMCPAQALVPRPVVAALGNVCIVPAGVQDYDYYLRIARAYPVTFHTASVARWRYRPDSMSGRHDVRGLRSAAQAVSVYERELEACAPDDRPVVRATIARRARHGVQDACRSRVEFATIPDPVDLAILYRAAPAIRSSRGPGSRSRCRRPSTGSPFGRRARRVGHSGSAPAAPHRLRRPGGLMPANVVVLALDSMDAGLMERWADAGYLPNFARGCDQRPLPSH